MSSDMAYLDYGLRTDTDEQIRRAFRDAFKRAGLTHPQLLEAMEWYRDHGQHLGGDVAKLTESSANSPRRRAGRPINRLLRSRRTA